MDIFKVLIYIVKLPSGKFLPIYIITNSNRAWLFPRGLAWMLSKFFSQEKYGIWFN